MIPVERQETPASSLFGSGLRLCGSYRLSGSGKQAVFDRFAGAKSPRHGSKLAAIGPGKSPFVPN